MRIMTTGLNTVCICSISAMADLMLCSTVVWVRMTISACEPSCTLFCINASMDTPYFAKIAEIAASTPVSSAARTRR